MGHRLEIYTTAEAAKDMIDIAAEMQIDARIIGRVVKNAEKKLTIHTDQGVFEY